MAWCHRPGIDLQRFSKRIHIGVPSQLDIRDITNYVSSNKKDREIVISNTMIAEETGGEGVLLNI